MIQVQIEITINPEKSNITVNLLSREDATPEEYELAKAIEQLHFSVLSGTGAKIKVTQIEDKRHLTKRAADDCPQGGSHVYKWDGTLPTEEMVECEKCGHRR